MPINPKRLNLKLNSSTHLRPRTVLVHTRSSAGKPRTSMSRPLSYSRISNFYPTIVNKTHRTTNFPGRIIDSLPNSRGPVFDQGIQTFTGTSQQKAERLYSVHILGSARISLSARVCVYIFAFFIGITIRDKIGATRSRQLHTNRV